MYILRKLQCFLTLDAFKPDVGDSNTILGHFKIPYDLLFNIVATITFWGIINSNEVNIHESMNMMCLLLTNIKLPKEGIFNHLKVIFTRINVSYLDNLFVPRTGC